MIVTGGGGIGVSAAGVANTIPKWTAANTLGNSSLSDDGTTVSLGPTQSPTSGSIPLFNLNGSFTPPSGSASYAAVQVNSTINGTSTGKAASLAIASKTNVLTGGTINLIDAGTTTTDYFTGYTQRFKLDTGGNVTATGNASFANYYIAAAGGEYGFSGNARLTFASTTAITLNGTTPLFQFGGTSASFPALKGVTTLDGTPIGLAVRLANDSGRGSLEVQKLIAVGFIESNDGSIRAIMRNGPTAIQMDSSGQLGWTASATDGSAALDTIISRDAANTVAHVNGTNAQKLNIYGTFTSSTSFERLEISYEGTTNNEYLIQPKKGSGGGTARPLTLGGESSRSIQLGTAAETSILGILLLASITTRASNANYTILASDSIIETTTAFTAARTFSLPASAAATKGKVFFIKDNGSINGANNLIVNVTGGGNIDGATSKTLLSAFDFIVVVDNGTKYLTISSLLA